MKKHVLSVVAVSTLFLASIAAIAQPSTPEPSPVAATASAAASPATPVMNPAATQPGRYVGPSSAVLSTVKKLVASGKDDQYALLQGKIISHEKGKNYTFADDSGRMSIEISSKRFPEGQTITAEQRVELSGKLDKGWNKTEFEVKEIRLLP